MVDFWKTFITYLILIVWLFCSFFISDAKAQGLGQPRNWVEESLNKTIVVEKNRTYTIQSSGTNVVIMPRESSPSGRVRPGEVKRYYGPSYRNDEVARSGCYCANRTEPRR